MRRVEKPTDRNGFKIRWRKKSKGEFCEQYGGLLLFSNHGIFRRIERLIFNPSLQLRRFESLSFTPGYVLRQLADLLPGVIQLEPFQGKFQISSRIQKA